MFEETDCDDGELICAECGREFWLDDWQDYDDDLCAYCRGVVEADWRYQWNEIYR